MEEADKNEKRLFLKLSPFYYPIFLRVLSKKQQSNQKKTKSFLGVLCDAKNGAPLKRMRS